jgi:hypothetical protein
MATAVQANHLPSFSLGLTRPSPSREILILGGILAVLQVLDGVLTGIGMHQFGTSAEGNILLRWLMESIGYVNALVLVKGFALVVIAILVVLANEVRWIGLAFKGIIALYVGLAVLPWTGILLRHFV